MRTILLIARKDFKQVVTSPLFFLVSALCTIVWTIMYRTFLQQFASQSMMSMMQGNQSGQSLMNTVFVQHISVVNLVLIFTLPALTMRLISEEKKLHTYDLLLTSPVSSTDIAVGKFLAGFGIASVLLFISFLYPAFTRLLAVFHWTTLLVLYLGIWLLTALYAAAGLFASSLTESAMLSVFMGVVFNLLIWFIGQSGAGSEIQWWASVANYISVGQHLVNFLKGMIKVSSLVFFVSSTAFFVFLSQRVVESSRWR